MVFELFLTQVAHNTYKNNFVTDHKFWAFDMELITGQKYIIYAS